jgi:NH3-dependent NAD+ synthetase
MVLLEEHTSMTDECHAFPVGDLHKTQISYFLQKTKISRSILDNAGTVMHWEDTFDADNRISFKQERCQ